MTTALCASPAARMRRGRDERRAEGAVTCGRATRACGAEHTFLSLLFFSLRPGRADTRSATHAQPHPAAVFFFCCAHSPDGETRLPSCLRASLSPHTRVTVLCGPHSHADERAEGSTNTQMTP
ncbi:hypothetical protein TcCL_Unassigned01237 [Trypanosoma cruzi]|nr:hypothetical protein TcCL_Unassigned01237 [Trypanosoma cruzi]